MLIDLKLHVLVHRRLLNFVFMLKDVTLMIRISTRTAKDT